MDYLQNIIEYHDELFPIEKSKKEFFVELAKSFPFPAKLLRIDCGTGLFEHSLAKEGVDITGIDPNHEMIRSANMRYRSQLMAIRFFQMPSLDITRFLAKDFFNIVTNLDERLSFVHDRTLLRKFFFDTKSLLKKNGVLVLELTNFPKFTSDPMAQLPVRESIRVKLFTERWNKDDGSVTLTQNLETGNGKILPVLRDVPIYPYTPEEIKDFAKEAGFTNLEFYANYSKEPFTGEQNSYIAIIK